MNKKKIVSLAVVVAMIAILSFSSLAWFSDVDSVKNEFMIADSDDDTADEVFSIDVWETDLEGNKTDVGVNYEDILPGSVLSKDPTIKNTGYYDQYVRAYVTISDVTELKEILGINSITEKVDLTGFFTVSDDFDATWHRNKAEDHYDVEKDTLTYVYYLNKKLAAGEQEVLFTAVKIPTSWTQEQMAILNTNNDAGFQIIIKAEAIQTENLGVGVDTALKAFDAVGWEARAEGPTK